MSHGNSMSHLMEIPQLILWKLLLPGQTLAFYMQNIVCSNVHRNEVIIVTGFAKRGLVCIQFQNSLFTAIRQIQQ